MCITRIILFTVTIWIICKFSYTSSSSPGAVNKKCSPLPSIRYGKIQYMQRRRFAMIHCIKGYLLAGDKVMICVDGQWEGTLPKCVKPTCPKIKSPENGLSYAPPELQGAVINFFCLYEYSLRGRATTYCNGTHWDNPLPVCQKTGTLPQTHCDFETNMCGWNPDLNHDFDWLRHNQRTPSRHVGTGPMFDHTKGPGQDGYYMYIESSSRIVNDTARFISPIFGKRAGCMELYYHMYGRSIGTLNIYVLSLSILQYSLSNLPKPMFTRFGNQGDAWLHAVIPLDDVITPFQIVIEGVRGSSYLSDIAIDDFKLSDSCPVEEFDTTTEENMNFSEMTGYTDIETMSSCVNRCNNDTTTTSTICQCTDSCILNYTCCPDFIVACKYDQFVISDFTNTYETDSISNEYMSTENNLSTINSMTMMPVQKTTTPVQRTTTPVQKTTTPVQKTTTPVQKTTTPVQKTTTPVQKTTTPVQKITIKPRVQVTTKSTMLKTTTQKRFEPRKITTSKIPSKINSSDSVIIAKKSSISPTTTVPTILARTTMKSGIKNVTKYIPTKKTTLYNNKSDFNKTTNKMIFTTKTTVKFDTKKIENNKNLAKHTTKAPIKIETTTTSSKINKKMNEIVGIKKKQTDNIRHNEVILFSKAIDNTTPVSRTYAFYTERMPILAPVESRVEVDGKTRVFVWIGVGVVIVLVALITTFVMRKYECPSRININKLKKHRCSTDSVSDVRFLTSDEILDFTLARPADETDSLL